MSKTIVVPLDGSDLAERALPFATRLASKAAARLLLLHAKSALVTEESPAYDLQALSARVMDEGVAAEPLVRQLNSDDVSNMIHETSREHCADLIVMSTHGRSGLGRWLYGSVADNVLRRADVPVIVVPAACERSWPTDQELRVMVAVDGSELAEAAIPPAAELADAVGAELLLYRAAEPPSYAFYGETGPYALPDPEAELAMARDYLDDLAEKLRTGERKVRTRASIGPAAFTIVDVAREEGVDLLAMATHGRGGLARFVLGSVATGVLQRARTPLLLVRPAAMRRASAEPTAPESGEMLAEVVTDDVPTGPTVTLTLSLADLDLLERGLADLTFSQQQDWRQSRPARELTARLKAAELAARGERVTV